MSSQKLSFIPSNVLEMFEQIDEMEFDCFKL